MAPDHDPDFARWRAAQQPALAHHRHAAARIERAALSHELAEVDAEMEVLAARRRAALAGLRRLRPQLWPSGGTRHGRRPPGVDEPALPPVPDDAVLVSGIDLRTVCLGILRRQGAISLRELHGLLHRHGYAIDSRRPVQRLADALAYEVAQGRCARVDRGVYAAVAAEPGGSGRRRRQEGGVELAEPLPWTDPDVDDPQLDPVVVDDPERWSGGGWPPQGVSREPDAPTGPAGRYPPSHLDEEVHLARARCAALHDRRRSASPASGMAPPRSPVTPTPDPDRPENALWERFVDESSPMVRLWAQRRREWWRRIEELVEGRRDAPDWPDRPADPIDDGDDDPGPGSGAHSSPPASG